MAENNDNGTAESPNPAEALALAEQAEAEVAEAEALAAAARARAEAAEAEALAVAARARARAIRLRGQGQSRVSEAPGESAESKLDGRGDGDTTTAAATATEVPPATTDDEQKAPDDDGRDEVSGSGDAGECADIEPPANEAPRSWRRWGRRRVWARVALGLMFVLICALLAASGYMIWQDRNAAAQRHRTAQFAAAARQGVVSLMTLDFNHAKEDVQRVLDNSTGQFRDDFQSRADDFIKVVQESKVVTKGSVNATAVQSTTDNSAVVLVAAKSQVTNATGAQNEPRAWRLSVTVTRDGGQIKMSKVEFMP